MKLFPIMASYGPREIHKTTDYIPYVVIEQHADQAYKNHGQTLERLAERGGLTYGETLAVLEDRPWTLVVPMAAKYTVFEIVKKFEEGTGND